MKIPNKDRVCIFEQCPRSVYARDHCKNHYWQMLRGGNLKPIVYRRPRGVSAWDEIQLALDAHGDSDECLTDGVGYINPQGYRRVNQGKSNKPVHRMVAQRLLPNYSADMPVHHTCAVRACFNPKHLQMVDHRENIAEMLERTAYLRRIASLEERVIEMEWEYFLRGVA